MNNLKVSVIIPNWNGKFLLEKNLQFVINALKNKRNNIREIIIVDDGSKDDSVSYLRKNFGKDVKLVVHKINRGFASAVNTGARTAKGELLCLLNTDVIPSEDFLEKTVKNFEDEKVFGVSLNEGTYGPSKGKFVNGFIVHEGLKEVNEKHHSFWVSGGSGVFRRSIWMELKGLDESLFAPFYWEDVDLSYRAIKRGYRILWEPDAKVEHKHESVINPNNFARYYLNLIKERNQLLFIWKNLTSKNLFKKHIRGLIGRTLRHPGYIKVVLAALGKIIVVIKLRKREIKESVISDEAIFAMF